MTAAIRELYESRDCVSTGIIPAMTAFKSLYSGPEEEAGETAFRLGWNRFMQAMLTYHLQSGKAFVHGHHPCANWIMRKYSQNYDFITIMRDPVDRFVSNYIYDRVGPIREYFKKPGTAERQLMDYLDSDAALWYANMQVTFLGGNLNKEYSFEADLEAAKKNLLQYRIVGFTEDMNSFKSKFRQIYGIELNISSINKTSDWVSKDDARDNFKELFTKQIRERIASLAIHEIKLFNFAREQFS